MTRRGLQQPRAPGQRRRFDMAGRHLQEERAPGNAEGGRRAHDYRVGMDEGVTYAGLVLLDDASNEEQRTTLGLSSLEDTLGGALVQGDFIARNSSGGGAWERVTLAQSKVLLGISSIDLDDIDANTVLGRTATGGTVDALTPEEARQVLDVGNTEQSSVWFCDYLVSGSSQNGWGSSSSGGSIGQHYEDVNTTTNAIGIVELRTGTGTSGRYALTTWNNAIVLGQADFVFEARVMLQALATETENFVVVIGFGDDWGNNVEHNDAAAWIYRTATDGDFWVAQTRSADSETKTVTSTAPGTSAFQILRVECDQDRAEVRFYIDGVLKATHTTNIPTTSQRMGLGLKIYKSAGTTQRELWIDWHRFSATRSAAR